jgi:diphthamide synthase subunit DPH2
MLSMCCFHSEHLQYTPAAQVCQLDPNSRIKWKDIEPEERNGIERQLLQRCKVAKGQVIMQLAMKVHKVSSADHVQYTHAHAMTLTCLSVFVHGAR